MSVTANDTQQIGLGILQRIAVREKARLQAHFLSQFYQSPESEGIVLCGSMALHGVYLHDRWSKDLDFDAPLEIAMRFHKIAEHCGLPLKRREGWEGHSSPQDSIPYIFSLPSVFYPEIAIGVEIFSRERVLVAAERHEFVAASGEQITVLVKPLAEILGVKLGCMFRRNKAMDFVDLWLGLSSDPNLCYQVKDLLNECLCEAGDFTPPKIIDANIVLEKLSSLQASWQENLSVYLTQVPDFAQVRCDLSQWLPLFDT